MKSHTHSTDSRNINRELSPSILPFAMMRMRCRRWSWLCGILMVSLFSTAFAENDFPAFWKRFKTAVAAGDKAAVAEMTKFPLSMPDETKAVKNKEHFLRRYNEIFKGEANAPQCFAKVEPRKTEDSNQYEVYCPFKDTPNDMENAPIRFLFELTKAGWKFTGLDNINE